MSLLSLEEQRDALTHEGWALEHIDTCLPEYVLDHCNGDREMLLGVIVGGRSTQDSVRLDLQSELAMSTGDKPDFDWDKAQDTIELCFLDADGEHPFDNTLEEDCADNDEPPQAWFRLSWPDLSLVPE